MNADERIQTLNQVPPLSNFEKKRKFRAAIVLALSTLMSIFFLVYAFIQKQEADKNFETLIQLRTENEQLKQIAEAARMEADRQRSIAMYNEKSAVEARHQAEKALQECKKRK